MKPTIKDSIVVQRSVGTALRLLEKRMNDLSIHEDSDLLEKLKADYALMCDYYGRGLCDPNGDEMYEEMLRRTYRLYNNVRLASIVKKRSAYSYSKIVANTFDKLYGGELAKTLEEFVQEIAMASLLQGEKQREAIKKTNAVHQRYIEQLFNSILVSCQWSDEQLAYYYDMLKSPTIDQNDALVIVSAITLALLTVFDVNKWLTLAKLYMDDVPVRLRQRALVGIVLGMPGDEYTLFPEISNTVERICADGKARHEMLELQMQMYYCLRTEADNAEIQREIMPTLAKGNNLKLTRSGIIENESTLDDILEANYTDSRIAELEGKMKRMVDMQKAGSDIYFGGFSHMKRFSFFHQISNWFAPFYMEHPDVTNVIDNANCEFLKKTLGNGPFCDSDRYSFAFALASIADKLPENVREMMGENVDTMFNAGIDKDSATYIRRMYLQDLYRFFMLYQDKNDFHNPFDEANGEGENKPLLFFASNMFCDKFKDEYFEAARFMFKCHRYDNVVNLVTQHTKNCKVANEELILLGYAHMKLGHYNDAHDIFNRLIGCGHTEIPVLKGLANALFMLRRYNEAAVAYDNLINIGCESDIYVVYRSLSLINSNRVKDGLSDLFRLDYEQAENANVKRAIGWGYLMASKPQEAERIYDALAGHECVAATDTLNRGYTKWILHKNKEAVSLFKQYINVAYNGDKKIANDFATDKEMLKINGIKDFEIKIMEDMLSVTIER